MPENRTERDLSLIGLCQWALGYAFRRKLPLAGVTVSMLLKVGLDILKPWPMVFLIDYVLRGDSLPAALSRFVEVLPGPATAPYFIGWIVTATVLIFLLSWAVGLATAYANISLGQRMVYDLAGDMFTKLQQLSLRFHASKSVGDTIRRVTADCTCVSIIVKDALLPVLAALVSLGAMFSIMWRIDPTLTLLAMAVAPYMMVVFWLYARPMMERSYEQQEIEGRIYSTVEQTFSALPAVQAFGREERNEERF